MSGIRVVLVDDLSIFTDAIAHSLSTLPEIEVVGRFRHRELHARREARTLAPDVIVVDPGSDADAIVTVLDTFAIQRPDAEIIVLTDSDDSGLALRVARAGANVWVDKRGPMSGLVEAIRLASRHWSSYPPQHLAVVLRGLRAEAAGATGRRADRSPSADKRLAFDLIRTAQAPETDLDLS